MDLRALIGNLLRAGVFTALALVLLGLFLYFAQNRGQEAAYGDFQELAFNFRSWFDGLIHFRGEAIMALGVMCLVLTPFLRVVISVIAFSAERDWLYVGIGTAILIIIIFSMLIGAVE